MADVGSATKDITQAIEQANKYLEFVWSSIASTAKEMGSKSITNLAIRRTLSYNPQNQKIFETAPRIKEGSQKLCDIISRDLQDLQNNPNNYQAWIQVGKAYLALSDFTNAYCSFTHVLRINPQIQDPYFWYAIACVYQHFQYNEDALKFFKNIGSLANSKQDFPLYSDYHLRLGLLYRSLRQYSQSSVELNLILKCPPLGLTEDDINFQIAFTQLAGGQQDLALREFKNLCDKYPKSHKIVQQYTWSLSFCNDDQSLNEAQRIIDLHPELNDDPLINFVLARLALKRGQMEVAYKKYCGCIPDWCESPVFWCGLGVLYFKNDQKQDALIAFQRALYQKAEIVEAWLNLGFIFEQLDNPSNAQKIYEAGCQNCRNSTRLEERLNRLSNPNSRNQVKLDIEEIKDSRFFNQIGDLQAQMILRIPPPIPANTIIPDEASARAIEDLRSPYETLFSNDQ
ncbi:TPR Domain containing protein [Trichomonas vaginalis G3]|uniref:TPR Domain containing protein n=1 Tax=Trichomonas vaginalis (strain ATCC PRA-98 / G3) TaxID=412133 RepID=A2E1K4_TRIV3|nr:cellular component assembly [Trichomonas vaginalis G3]EAY13451.1 TPR Domain containing protein [Trichomonas vaginalis G3]KAI5518355.1 cellular component assembly [Trichomonas vaginalis G3]|eukprot:XP_001325674.1 TPR Domain containing protein [Trichomonas vaginalis G3]